jgi:hypothetical protein
MIRYALICDRQHDFEGWFRDSAAFDTQAAEGLVLCPRCQSAAVEKQIMSPGVARSDRASATPMPAANTSETAPESPPESPPEPTSLALVDGQARELRAMITAWREHVTKTADYVGPRFAQEARRIHDGEVESRSIYGEATLEEAKALAEDGISALPLPIIPGERN